MNYTWIQFYAFLVTTRKEENYPIRFQLVYVPLLFRFFFTYVAFIRYQQDEEDEEEELYGRRLNAKKGLFFSFLVVFFHTKKSCLVPWLPYCTMVHHQLFIILCAFLIT